MSTTGTSSWIFRRLFLSPQILFSSWPPCLLSVGRNASYVQIFKSWAMTLHTLLSLPKWMTRNPMSLQVVDCSFHMVWGLLRKYYKPLECVETVALLFPGGWFFLSKLHVTITCLFLSLCSPETCIEDVSNYCIRSGCPTKSVGNSKSNSSLAMNPLSMESIAFLLIQIHFKKICVFR